MSMAVPDGHLNGRTGNVVTTMPLTAAQVAEGLKRNSEVISLERTHCCCV